jgi:hypothetical protein
MNGKKKAAICSPALAGELVATPELVRPLRKYRYQLRDLKGTRRLMASVICEARCGLIATDEASRLVYMLAQLTKTLESTLLEERLRRLEAAGDL